MTNKRNEPKVNGETVNYTPSIVTPKRKNENAPISHLKRLASGMPSPSIIGHVRVYLKNPITTTV